MSPRPLVLTALALTAALEFGSVAFAQSGSGYPYRGTAPSGYRGSEVTTPGPTISPGSVSRSAHSRPQQGSDRSLSGDGLGAGITGDRLPGFLTNQDARTDRLLAERIDTTARIRLRVPADAQVWVDGNRTQQTGEARRFFSPPLTPGKRYFYNVRVRWMKDGEPVQEQRRVAVAAGARVEVDFTRPAPENEMAPPDKAASVPQGSGRR